MKILLTGATGFLGKQLLAEFLRHGHKLVITKRASTDLNPVFDHFGKLDAWGTQDEELDDLFRAHPDLDAIVHAATEYGRDASRPTESFWVNEAFPVRLLELAIRHRVRLFINMDTFFNTNGQEYDYLNAYTISKRHFQEWGKNCGDSGHIAFSNLRLFHLYGPGDSFHKFVPTMVRLCLTGEEIQLTGGSQQRDFIHVDDAVAAVSLVLNTDLEQGVGYRHYDVGTGKPHSIKVLVERIKNLCRSDSKLNFGALPYRNGELLDAYADTQAMGALGWKPLIDIEMGIATVIEDVRQRIAHNPNAIAEAGR